MFQYLLTYDELYKYFKGLAKYKFLNIRIDNALINRYSKYRVDQSSLLFSISIEFDSKAQVAQW